MFAPRRRNKSKRWRFAGGAAGGDRIRFRLTRRGKRERKLFAKSVLHCFLFHPNSSLLCTLPMFFDHACGLLGMIDIVERDLPHKGAHDHIAIIQNAAKWVCLYANCNDRAERRFLPAIINTHYLFKPDGTLVGDNVIIIAPIDPRPIPPTK